MSRITSKVPQRIIRAFLVLFLVASFPFASAISAEEHAYAASVTKKSKAKKVQKAFFNPNGGTLPLAKRSKTIKNGSLFGVLPVPKRAAYVFKGWYTTKKQTGGVLVTGKSKVRVTGNRTLYARWEKPQRIACVGGSNVYGLFLKEADSFPGKLQKKMGRIHTVKNFGSGGKVTATLRHKTPYIRTKAFAKSIAFKPDKVVVNLGLNDLRKEHWKDFAKKYKNTGTLYNKIADSIIKDYKKLLSAYEKHASKSEIYIMNCVDAIPSKTRQKIQYLKAIPSLNARLKSFAKREGYKFIDINAAIKKNPRYYLLKDGVHFSLAGAEKIASMTYQAVK